MNELTKIPSESFYYILKNKIGKKLLDILEKNNAFLAGGACRAWFANEEVIDYDFFFSSELNYENFNKKQKFLVINNFDELTKYEKIWGSDNAETYKNLDTNAIIQFIKHNYSEIKDQVSKFDFTVCAIAYDLKEKCFYAHPKFFDDLNEKKLRLIINENSMMYPLSELQRIAKYSRKGYTIKEVDIVKILLFIGKKFSEIKTYSDFKREINGMDINLIDGIFEETSLKLENEFNSENLYTEIIKFCDRGEL